MTVITYRELQRLTVKELLARIPLTVSVNGAPMFTLTKIDSQASDSQSNENLDSQEDDSADSQDLGTCGHPDPLNPCIAPAEYPVSWQEDDNMRKANLCAKHYVAYRRAHP